MIYLIYLLVVLRMISTKLFSNAITETMVSILYVYMNFLYDYINR